MSIDKPQPRSNIKDVADRAGVSPATVSNVLNRPQRVAPATRRRVLETIDRVGYVRNASASRLRTLENRALGLLIADVKNEFFVELARGAQEAAEELGFTTLLCDGAAAVDRIFRQIDFLTEHRVAGVLVGGASLPGVSERLARLRDHGVAVVLADERTGTADHCAVGIDDIRGGQLVGEHLMSLGYGTIAYVQLDVPFAPFEDRLAGLRDAVSLHAEGAPVKIHRFQVPVSGIDDAPALTAQILEAGCDAVFCANDTIAIAVYRALVERGVAIPDDVALIGFDDTQIASMLPVPLSSVSQPARLMGATAARLLIGECTGEPHTHQRVIFQPKLVPRASTVGSRLG